MDIEQIKSRLDLLRMAEQDTQLKRVASTAGGEFAGPCPFCHGRDRFRVQPFREDGAHWLCRGCNPRWSDVIDYVARRAGLSQDDKEKYKLAQQLAEGCHMVTSPAPAKQNEETEITPPGEEWQRQALATLSGAIDNLWSDEGDKARAWLHWRGLNDATLQAWKIGYSPGEIYIPNFVDGVLFGIKIRCHKADPPYKSLTGSKTYLYGTSTLKDANVAILFESELDALLAWQSWLGLGYIALPAGQPFYKQYARRHFATVEDLIIAPDNDAPGIAHARKVAELSKHFHIGGTVPRGKDLTEFFQAGGSPYDWVYDELQKLDGHQCQ